MFTIKAFRKDASGKERIFVSEARSYSIQRDDIGLDEGEVFVICLDPYGDHPAITVTYKKPEPNQWLCYMVCVENSNGKTTDVVRPIKPPK